MKSWLPRLKEENPQLEINEVLKRGGHPFLEASYSKLYLSIDDDTTDGWLLLLL